MKSKFHTQSEKEAVAKVAAKLRLRAAAQRADKERRAAVTQMIREGARMGEVYK